MMYVVCSVYFQKLLHLFLFYIFDYKNTLLNVEHKSLIIVSLIKPVHNRINDKL